MRHDIFRRWKYRAACNNPEVLMIRAFQFWVDPLVAEEVIASGRARRRGKDYIR